MLYAAWIIAERIALSLSPATEDIGWVRAVESLSPFQNILLMVVIGPLTEELLYRGALFSALMRRWGPWVAIIAPSILWALFHTQYGQWLIISIAVSGVVLGITRWKGGSIVVPLGLHVAGNLFDLALS
jgi:hypothetical protein